MSFNFPGLVYTSNVPSEPPMICVTAYEKTGKSTLTTTLFDWPSPGGQPFVIAVDATGPDSCTKLGFRVAHVKVRDQPGQFYHEKMRYLLNNLEGAIHAKQWPFSSIVVDCVSSLVDKMLYEDMQANPAKDDRVNYKNVGKHLREFLHRIRDLGLPTVWLAWQREPIIEEKKLPNGNTTRRAVMGGPMIAGSQMRGLVAGLAHMILPLEKSKIGVGQPGADSEGYVRLLHTRTWENIEAGGRYTLPEPCPAHLGYVLSIIMGMIPNPALGQVQQSAAQVQQ